MYSCSLCTAESGWILLLKKDFFRKFKASKMVCAPVLAQLCVCHVPPSFPTSAIFVWLSLLPAVHTVGLNTAKRDLCCDPWEFGTVSNYTGAESGFKSEFTWIPLLTHACFHSLLSWRARRYATEGLWLRSQDLSIAVFWNLTTQAHTAFFSILCSIQPPEAWACSVLVFFLIPPLQSWFVGSLCSLENRQ